MSDAFLNRGNLGQGAVQHYFLGRCEPTATDDVVRRLSRIERKFAEQKRYHGLRRARYWGLTKVTIQALMTCIVVNCKRLAKLWEVSCSPPRAGLCPLNDTGM